MDQLGGIRTLIDRLGLPPRLKIIVENFEREYGPLDQVGPTKGAAEVRQILGMVDGQNLLAALVSMLCNDVVVDDEIADADARAMDTRTLYDRWLDASHAYPNNIVLLKDGDAYVAFDGQGERLAAELGEHQVTVGRSLAVALTEVSAPSWSAAIADKNLDVLLVVEDDEEADGYSTAPVVSLAHEEGARVEA